MADHTVNSLLSIKLLWHLRQENVLSVETLIRLHCMYVCMKKPPCAGFQMQLLFSKSPKHQLAVSKLGSSATQSCQPYLLTLLTHQASWGTLHRCLENLLGECNENYDPTAVLDFLWALTYHPKLWQGREKCTPKHHSPEDILGLTPPQVRLSVFEYCKECSIKFYKIWECTQMYTGMPFTVSAWNVML